MTQYLSKNEKRKLLDLIDRGLVCKSEEDFKTHLLSPLVELIGTEIGLSIWGNPSKGKVDGAIDLNFPEEYVNLYLHHFFEDPAFRLWLSKQEPFIFSPKVVSKSHNNCIAANFDLRTRNGIFHGLAERGFQFVSHFTFSRINERMGKRHSYILELLIPHLHQALVRVLSKREKPSYKDNVDHLTERELEILKWTKEGKSGWDISVIMGISENTVRFHIKNILKKWMPLTRPMPLQRQ